MVQQAPSALSPHLRSGVTTRLDAHCHSNASDGAAVAALGLIGCPECYSPPEKVYEQARLRGMDLFTLTDHDTIAGALSLQNRGFPGVILGQEVTVYFPEDRCKLHVLVWALTPEHHEELASLNLRSDVYKFAAWLHQHQLPHALAHPLYIQNKKLTKWHLDRCALLFKGFELLNGAHSGTHRAALDAYIKSLTPGKIHRLIQETGIEPCWPRIWDKVITGGSDDHGLLNVGRTCTQVSVEDAILAHTPTSAITGEGKVTDPREFFRIVMSGRSAVGGDAGHSSLLAHQLTTVGMHYAANRLAHKFTPIGKYGAGKVLRFAGAMVPRPGTGRLAWHYLKGKLSRKRRPFTPLIDAIRSSFAPVLANHPSLADRLSPNAWPAGSALADHDAMSRFADDLYAAAHQFLASSAVQAWRAKDRKGGKQALIDHLISYAALELSQAPYIFSLFHQNKERLFVDRIAHDSAEPGQRPLDRPMRVLLFTDTLGDVNGVSRFIRNAADQALATGRDFRVLTSTNFTVPTQDNIINFKPVFATTMPKYENLELVLPPLVKMLREADRLQPDVIHVSTPGPVGTVGLIAAKMLKCPVLGVYHTDFPAYVDHLFQDEGATWLTSQWMKIFYHTFANVFTRSTDYIPSLEKIGIQRSNVVRLKPGIRTEQFQPSFRNEALMRTLGCPADTVRVLYCGRVSLEKNMPLLTQVWTKAGRRLADLGINAELVVVGDGPYREQMQRELNDAGTKCRFLGFRHGEELSAIYASCDLFAFPSTTDTLGQVVMESQSSGLPVLVTDKGGPQEVVRQGETGFVIPSEDVNAWVDRVVELCSNPDLRQRMGHTAHAFMQSYSMVHSFEHYWSVHEDARREHLAKHGIVANNGHVNATVNATINGHASAPLNGSANGTTYTATPASDATHVGT